MNHLTFPAAAAILNLLPIGEISATKTGAGVDLQPYRGVAIALLDVSANTAGAAPTLATKLQTSPEADKVTRANVVYAGTGNGHLEVEAGPDPVAETITLTALADPTTFSVVGGTSGNLGTATVGTRFTSANVNLLITAGDIAFVTGDAWTVPTTARAWTDAGDFTAQTTAALREKKLVNCDRSPRYLRAVSTLGGAGTKYIGSCNLLVPAAE